MPTIKVQDTQTGAIHEIEWNGPGLPTQEQIAQAIQSSSGPSVGGLIQNFKKDIKPAIKASVTGLADTASQIVKRMPGMYTPQQAGEDVQAVRGLGSALGQAAANPVESAKAVAKGAGTFAYEHPVQALSMLAGPARLMGFKRLATAMDIPGLAFKGAAKITPGKEWLQGHAGRLNMAAFSPTGTELASESAELPTKLARDAVLPTRGSVARLKAKKAGAVASAGRAEQAAPDTMPVVAHAQGAKKVAQDLSRTAGARYLDEAEKAGTEYLADLNDPRYAQTGQIPFKDIAKGRRADWESSEWQRGQAQTTAEKVAKSRGQSINAWMDQPGRSQAVKDFRAADKTLEDVIPELRVAEHASQLREKTMPFNARNLFALTAAGGLGGLVGASTAGMGGAAAGATMGPALMAAGIAGLNDRRLMALRAAGYYRLGQTAPAISQVQNLAPVGVTEEALRRALLEQMGEPR